MPDDAVLRVTEAGHSIEGAGSTIPHHNSLKWTLRLSLLLFAVTFLVFRSACDNGFVNLDDNLYVCNQREVLGGLTWQGLRWVSTAVVVGNWHPLTMLSLQLDAELFGRGPLGFHRTSVVIHSMNAVLVFLMLFTLTGCQFRSLIAAAFFALHPLRVESVAWVSERKDVLSGFFFCLTILSYVYYTRSPSFFRYLPIGVCLALGLSAKSMLVTTPCVLLLLDYWPLGRTKRQTEEDESSLWLGLIAEKLPLFGLSAIFSLITLASQEPGINSLAEMPLSARVGNAATGCVAYLRQTIFPSGLRPFYPLRDDATFDSYFETAFLLSLTGLAFWLRRRCPFVLVGWLWFLGMLFPVSGIMQTGGQARADRYTYLPSVGLWIAAVWLVADLFSRSRRACAIWAAMAAVCLASFGFVTVRQIEYWRNTETLFRRIYQFSPRNTMVIQPLVNTLIQTGKTSEALELTEEAVRSADESDQDQMVMLAMLLAVQHHHAACERVLDSAIKHHPETAELYSNRGKARAAQGKWDEAADDFRLSLRLSPRNVSFPFYLAHALGKIGEHEESRRLYVETLRKSPTWPQTAATDAWRMSTSADQRERVNFWPQCLAEQAIEASPENASSIFYLDVLAAAYAHDGRYEEAVQTARKALEQAKATKQIDLIPVIQERVQLYERREPYRQALVDVNPTP